LESTVLSITFPDRLWLLFVTGGCLPTYLPTRLPACLPVLQVFELEEWERLEGSHDSERVLRAMQARGAPEEDCRTIRGHLNGTLEAFEHSYLHDGDALGHAGLYDSTGSSAPWGSPMMSPTYGASHGASPTHDRLVLVDHGSRDYHR
jgi:hypothetical protein